MHRFSELIWRCANFGLSALDEASQSTTAALQTSAETRLVKTLQMIEMQKAIIAVGMFSLFEASLQDALQVKNGFEGAHSTLKSGGELELAETFRDYQRAINVLKHGKGRSYDELVSRADRLPFRILMPNENFFFEGDVSEVSTLVQVDNLFVKNCAEIIGLVSGAIRKINPNIYL